MSEITGLTRGGEAYTPKFVMELNQASCIGCGRCYKVCPRDVFTLVERGDIDADFEDDDDDFDDDDNSMVMALSNALDCIGCEACSRVCPKNCMTHAPSAVAA
ncbi:MAG: ferredoxin III, nif-specific [Pseudomonadota bacterium]